MAMVERLEPFKYLNLIGSFAERFSQHPDQIFKNTSFNTICNFAIYWKEVREFDDRYFEADRLMNQQP